jgi:hypothetical protein
MAEENVVVPAVPPTIEPREFESYPTFRETFLLYVPDPDANSVLRGFGRLVYEFVLDYWRYWPDHPEGLLRASLRAVLADLRCAQGFLAQWTSPDASPRDEALAQLGEEIARELGLLAQRLDAALVNP